MPQTMQYLLKVHAFKLLYSFIINLFIHYSFTHYSFPPYSHQCDVNNITYAWKIEVFP